MGLQNITLGEVKAAARLAHSEGRLVAQSGVGEYAYESGPFDGKHYHCAIGAAMNEATIQLVHDLDANESTMSGAISTPSDSKLFQIFAWDNAEAKDLDDIQNAHDAWQTEATRDLKYRDDVRINEAEAIRMLNALGFTAE